MYDKPGQSLEYIIIHRLLNLYNIIMGVMYNIVIEHAQYQHTVSQWNISAVKCSHYLFEFNFLVLLFVSF